MPDSQQAVWDERYALRKNKAKLTRLVLEGDSWFAYPVWRNMGDFIDASNKYAICRRGESGRLLKQIVDDGLYADAVASEHPKAVLISGSGNDFVNHRFVTGADGGKCLFNDYVDGMKADELINEEKWTARLDKLGDYFETIIERVGGVPVITHGYDYILPSGVKACYDGINMAGPWILPTMKKTCHIVDPNLQRAIVALMIDSLNEMMASVQNKHTGLFSHVDLRGIVMNGQWANEIHPYEAGFKALAKKMLVEVDRVVTAHDSAVAGDGPG